LHGSGSWHLGMAGVGGRPLRGPWIPDAVQGQCCSPPSYPQAAAPGHELGRIRRGLAPAREPDGLVHRGGDRGLGGRAAHHAGRATILLGSGDHDSADAQGRVPLGAAPDRGADRLDHSPAGSRSLCSRPYHLEPPGGDLGGATATVGQRGRARSSAGGQHGSEALRARGVADREAWHGACRWWR